MLIEGQGQATDEVEGANTGASPTPDATQTVQTSPASGAKPGEVSVPFHENPELKGYLERQRKSWDRDNQVKTAAQIAKMQADSDAKYQALESKLNNGNVSEENSQQLRALAKLINSDPEARKMLGLDGIQELRDKLSQYEQGNQQNSFNGELVETAKSYAEKYGYDAKEVEQDLLEYIQNDPLWGQMGNSKGVIKKAAKDYFSEKTEELAERAANMKLVNEAKNKGKVSSQKPANGATQTLPEPKSFREAIKQSMTRHGVQI